jgi:hypothetical protein
MESEPPVRVELQDAVDDALATPRPSVVVQPKKGHSQNGLILAIIGTTLAAISVPLIVRGAATGNWGSQPDASYAGIFVAVTSVPLAAIGWTLFATGQRARAYAIEW